ncbi:hypothetical protein CMO83_02590 [Candidatus Woesearchaeota archaeon]|jgi:hypothetical protein|nr:hypothetical protein [Candidatus Woesearchaeota archaeon]MDP6647945.1 hypothetical protein [Candidatus Woesearchaeota archaeon]|tara:strand:+ start:9680 stop:11452 length:1773 start_codon:yes stop_codon:yes gene_type:complete
MKYNESEFNSAVEDYKKHIKDAKNKNFFIIFDIDNKEAFYSLAPLSRALHELGSDVSCAGINKKSEALEALQDVWKVFDDNENKVQNDKTKALIEFISEVDKKTKGEFKEIFKKPEFILEAKSDKFVGSIELPFHTGWFKDHRMEELMQTSEILWRDVYNLKKGERAGIGFTLIPTQDLIGHPLEDYLDSYSIIWAMTQTAKKIANPAMSAATSRNSMLEKGERTSELRATLLGCELCKNLDEEPFIKYKQVSDLLNLSRIKPIDLSFHISAKGYPGKHLFGKSIGYPSLNKKTRWQTPGQMVYKLDFYPQTKFDDRDPMARVAFTETIPIDIFIETNLVDWADIRARNQRIKDEMDKCDVIYVEGKLKEKYTTKLEVGLVKKDGSRRWVRRSDTDVREKINKTYLEMTGIKAGNMGNIPGGEAFTTPEYMKGIFVGDVVVHVDQSYGLDEKNPLVVECYGDNYKIIDGPKDIMDKINQRKNEAMKLLLEAEKHKSLPKEIIDMKKKNFERVGEFAINTNPKARLCEYLIINEKIAKMMHIALGSGFEPDRSTEYHMDIVFNAPRQKLDVYGVDKEGNKHWILKDGNFSA